MRKTERASSAERAASRGREFRAAARKLVTESPPLRNDPRGNLNGFRMEHHFVRGGDEKTTFIYKMSLTTQQIEYTALFVDNPEKLLSMFPARHPKVYAHHST